MESDSAEGRERHWKELRKKTRIKYKAKMQICGSNPSAGVHSPSHHCRNSATSYEMISSLLGLHFGSCVQEQYFKHGLRNNSTYEFDKNNLEFCKLHRNE